MHESSVRITIKPKRSPLHHIFLLFLMKLFKVDTVYRKGLR